MNPIPGPSNFVREIVIEDLKTNKYGGRVHTRFPPEPNGYLHIGHAKSINLNFGLAAEFGGKCNLRFDDTNPSKEETEYVDSIIKDVRWLGGDWEDRLFYASDYFDQLYEWAAKLIKSGSAYACDLTGDQVREYRGTWPTGRPTSIDRWWSNPAHTEPEQGPRREDRRHAVAERWQSAPRRSRQRCANHGPRWHYPRWSAL